MIPLLHIRIDAEDFVRAAKNAGRYSEGFLEGVQLEQRAFNERLGDFVVDALGKYIDSHARMDPESLHHVYEWGQVGNPSARLFEINAKATNSLIHFGGSFLASKSVSPTSTEPFVNKAKIMENGIGVTVVPNDVLAFEDDGELVFTTQAVYIAHPGGEAVEGSFGRVVEEFFDGYLTNAILAPFLQSLSNPVEYYQNFAAGVKSGKGVGVSTGKKYLKSAGAELS